MLLFNTIINYKNSILLKLIRNQRDLDQTNKVKHPILFEIHNVILTPTLVITLVFIIHGTTFVENFNLTVLNIANF